MLVISQESLHDAWSTKCKNRAQHCQFNASHPIMLYDIKEILNYLSHQIINGYHHFVKLCVTACFNQKVIVRSCGITEM